MMGMFSKSKFIHIVSCFALVAFLTSPCNCYAKESKQSKKENTQRAHDCCDESNENNNKTGDCGNCNSCSLSASSTLDSLSTKLTISSTNVDLKLSLKPLAHSWILFKEDLTKPTLHATGPPGHNALSSSARSSLLQRWLI